MEKLKKYLIDFIKEEGRFITGLFVVLVTLTYELPYYIDTGGGTINVDDRIIVENGYNQEGSYNLAYVSSLNATIPTYLFSYLMPTWEVKPVESYTYNSTETVEDVEKRDRVYLNDANQNAIELAYNKAGKDFKITDSHIVITYIDESAKTDLKVGDTIIKLDGHDYKDSSELRDKINEYKPGDVIEFTVLREEKEITATATIQEGYEGRVIVGVYLVQIYEYETNPKIELNFLKSEVGPSGGLTLSLAIYDSLIEEDLTKGRKIVGTGTITNDGRVGEIGGVTYKLRGAINSKADLFIVPAGDNYNEAIEYAKEKNFDIKIVPVSTFDEAIDYLKNN